MAADSISLSELRTSGILEEHHLAALMAEHPLGADTRLSVRALVQASRLTGYQAGQLAEGLAGGLVVGPYVLLEKLGEGGMGAVFRARHHGLDRLVALKLIRGQHLAGPDAVVRFRREARAAAQFRHPKSVVVHDADQAGERSLSHAVHCRGARTTVPSSERAIDGGGQEDSMER